MLVILLGALRPGKVTTGKLAEAICVYLLLGLSSPGWSDCTLVHRQTES